MLYQIRYLEHNICYFQAIFLLPKSKRGGGCLCQNTYILLSVLLNTDIKCYCKLNDDFDYFGYLYSLKEATKHLKFTLKHPRVVIFETKLSTLIISCPYFHECAKETTDNLGSRGPLITCK